jgi:ferredoxin
MVNAPKLQVVNGLTIKIDSTCTACGACLVTCPTAALAPAPRRPAVEEGRCTGCLACVEVCPVDAIAIAVAVGGPAAGGGAPAR